MTFTLNDIKKSACWKVNGLKPDKPTPQERYQALGRIKGRKMNKTEAAYNRLLEVRKGTGEVLWYAFEAINLRIGDNCFYRVDFFVLNANRELEAHEVKGYWTDDALVKIKVAAENFPFKFIAARLIKGEWEVRQF